MSIPMTADKAFEMYRPLVEQNEQAMPILAWVGPDDEMVVCGIALGDFPQGWGMQQVLESVIEQMKPRLGRPKALIFSSEGWMKKAVRPDEFANMDTSPGAFQREVNAGAKLAEAITLTAVSFEEGWSRIVPFERAEDGTVTWEDALDCPAAGGIADVLREGILTP